MFGYAPQRQRLPLIHSRISASLFRVAFLDAGDGGTNLAGRAIAALESIVLEKRRLHRMQLVAVREPFDGRDLIAFVRDREAETGVHPAAVDQHSAGAALAVIATFLRAGQMQMFAQRIEQGRPRIDFQLWSLPLILSCELDWRRAHAARGGRFGFSRFGRSESHQGRSQRNRRAGSRDLFEKTPARPRVAEDQELIQTAGRIDSRQFRRIDPLRNPRRSSF